MDAKWNDNDAREYAALQQGCGVVELLDWSCIKFAGADRQMFLHNFCTNDIKRLAPGQGCEAFFTNAKGKIVGHGWVECRDDELTIVGPPGQASALVQHLDRYIIREDVQLTDATVQISVLLVAGGEAAHEAFESRRRFGWRIAGSQFAAILEVTPGEQAEVLAELAERGAVAVSKPVFAAARLEAGVPLFGIDFTEQNLPQEANRNAQAISFTKGCYLGQETVARIDALGHVNQHIVGVRFDGDDVPEAGTELVHNGTAAGRVTSGAFSPRLNAPLALAMVHRGACPVGTKLGSDFGTCEVVSLPVADE
jgi:tRNA-modifying protein YgfZ